MLIDESPRTFKKGMIITATVSKVLPSKAICRLDNGLPAIIHANYFLEGDDKRDFSKLLD